jgi:opacity protein-like surface antigen
MRTIKIALLATVAGAALTTTTLAADPIVMLDPTPVVEQFSGFDWEGVYAGLYVTGRSDSTAPGVTDGVWGVGGNVGVNFLLDPVLLGVEGDISIYTDNNLLPADTADWTGQAVGRVGVLVTDNVLAYGLAGFGAHSDTGGYVPVGAGLEVALGDRFSLKGQYEYHWDVSESDALATTTDSAHVGKFGFNFHF